MTGPSNIKAYGNFIYENSGYKLFASHQKAVVITKKASPQSLNMQAC